MDAARGGRLGAGAELCHDGCRGADGGELVQHARHQLVGGELLHRDGWWLFDN